MDVTRKGRTNNLLRYDKDELATLSSSEAYSTMKISVDGDIWKKKDTQYLNPSSYT